MSTVKNENAIDRPISELMTITMQKIKEMVDINTIIGDPIKLEDGTTIIPISKVSYGFASGGSDLPSKLEKSLFGGGAGAGASIKPEGFLVVKDGDAKMVPMTSPSDPIGSVISSLPGAVEKVTAFFKKKDKDGEEGEDGEETEEKKKKDKKDKDKK